MLDRAKTTPGLHIPEYPQFNGTPVSTGHTDTTSLGVFYGQDSSLEHRLTILKDPNSQIEAVYSADGPRFKRAGYKRITSNFFPVMVVPGGDVERADNFWQRFMEHYDNNEQMLAASPDVLMKVVTKSDLRRCLEGNRIGVTTSVEGIEGYIYGDETKDLKVFEELREKYGITNVMLTWNWINRYSGSNKEPKEGLTSYGKDAFQAMQDVGMLFDTAHMSHQGMEDALKLATKPGIVFNSHAGFYALVPHGRNVPTDTAKEITKQGGMVDISHCVGTFMGRKGVDAICDQIEFGWDNGIRIGLGGDENGVGPGSFMELGDVITTIPAIVIRLKQRGATDNQIVRLMGWEDIEYHLRMLPEEAPHLLHPSSKVA